MLRSLIQPESKLIKLCQSKEWGKVIHTIKHSPNEAKPSSSAYRGISNTALIVVIRNTAPLFVIKALVEANSDQLMKVRHHRHGNALHEAIKYKSSIDVVLFLIETIIVLERQWSWVSMNRGELRPLTIQCSSTTRSKTPGKVDDSQKMNSPSSSSSSSSFNSNHRIHTHCTLFNQNDSLGRTPLHCLVDRFSKKQGVPSTNFIKALTLLITAFPPAVGKIDAEGLTPLDISLITKTQSHVRAGVELEMKVYDLVKIMIDAFPSAAAPRINAAQAHVSSATCTHPVIEANMKQSFIKMNYNITTTRTITPTTNGLISHNTLSHALMHGRHLSTIELLIGASKATNTSWYTGQILQEWEEYDDHHGSSQDIISDNEYHDLRQQQQEQENQSCMAIVSKDLEVPLHIAVTMKASPEIIAYLIDAKPEASTILDRFLLSPICWAWIRYVIDEIEMRGRGREATNNDSRMDESHHHHGRMARWSAVKPSRRRFIPANFLTVHEEITEKSVQDVKTVIDIDNTFATSSGTGVNQRVGRESIEKRSLLSNLANLLPQAARVTVQYQHKDERLFGYDNNHEEMIKEKWNPVHAAAYVNCPKGVLLSVIYNNPLSIKEVDQYGNLPIHYAAARRGYSKSIPIGVNCKTEDLMETSNLWELVAIYPDSTKLKNKSGQFPLHIAIEEHKKHCAQSEHHFKRRLVRSSNLGMDDNKRQRLFNSNKESIEESPIMCLIRADVDSLEQRDSITHLYPFMQIAAGYDNCVSLDFIFVMLQLNPNLVKTKLVSNSHK